jgi:hypothetical protein
VSEPGALEVALLQALVALPRRRPMPIATRSQHVWTIPARVRDFTGRSALLGELERALPAGGPAVAHAVTGMGCVGKTATALEYAHRHASEFDIAWWVPAEDPALIPARLAELARALDLAGATDPPVAAVARLLGALSERNAGWWSSTTPKTPAP